MVERGLVVLRCRALQTISGIGRRGLLLGGGAVVVAVLAVAVVLALGGDADDPSPVAQPSPTTVGPSPAATRPSSRDVAGSAGASTGQESCTENCAPDTTEQASRREPVAAVDEDDRGARGGSSLPTGPLFGAAGVLLVVGGLWELRRHQSRPSEEVPPDPDSAFRPPPQPDVDRQLADRSDEADETDTTNGTNGTNGTDKIGTDKAAAPPKDRVGAALGHLARGVGQRNGRVGPQPRVVRVSDARIDVLLSKPDPSPPSPWQAEASGLSWVLGADATLPTTSSAGHPLPALVTVGTSESDILVDIEAYGVIGTSEPDILVNLEAYGVVALVGDEAACRAMAHSMAAELSGRAARGEVAVTIVGDPLDDAAAMVDGVVHQASWKTVDASPIDAMARLLETGGWRHTWAARASGSIPDAWTPTVWITKSTDERRYLDLFAAVASRPGAGIVMLVVGHDPNRGLRIHLDAQGRFDIPDLALHGTARTPAVT